MTITEQQRMSGEHGITLIEMVIVVSILMIVAALVFPNYTDRVQRAKRVDAKSILMTAAAEQEKFFMKNNRFATTLVELNVTETEQELYALSLSSPTATEFVFTATAQAGQANDDDCKTFSINQVGRKTATDDSNADNTDKCWR